MPLPFELGFLPFELHFLGKPWSFSDQKLHDASDFIDQIARLVFLPALNPLRQFSGSESASRRLVLAVRTHRDEWHYEICQEWIFYQTIYQLL